MADTILLHLKPHPLFVSDAMGDDVEQTLRVMGESETEEVRELARRLNSYLRNGRMHYHTHRFWTSPLAGWEMPSRVREELAASHLVIIKGDANYRRLLGDRHWPYTTPFRDITHYFPAPLVAIRTLKSEVAAGLPPERVSELNKNAPGWTTSGEWGLIEFSERKAAHQLLISEAEPEERR